MSLTRLSLLGTVFFQTALPCSGGYHMERGGMPLHDAVGINCEKGATAENQDSAIIIIIIIIKRDWQCKAGRERSTPFWSYSNHH